MATPDEIVTSLVMDEIPVKLRCAACNKLAVNAFRMPCCDQSICETCQSSLPQACPVCLHEPVKADDCRPNKALRTTIKVFLRKKGIEREAARKKELLDKTVNSSTSSANTPIDQKKELSPPQISANFFSENGQPNGVGTLAPRRTSSLVEPINGPFALHAPQTSPVKDQMDIPRPSIESANDGNQKEGLDGKVDDKVVNANGVQEQKDTSRSEFDQSQGHEELSNPNGLWGANPGAGSLLNNNGVGLDGMNAAFPTMDFSRTGDFGQMMQFLPNGMQPGGMGTFPNMMMIPGMGMDPMAMSQGMYGGLGTHGMGMNGMNGMNVGVGFNAGQGVFGGFNGQPAAWNAGQDKFNPNTYVGHSTGMAGDFGGNVGYGGYNMPQHQGNFNQIHHPYQNNDFHNGYNGQGFQNRGRGRGRGYHNAGRGRGGHNQVNAGNQSNYEPFHHQIPQPFAKPDPLYQQVMSGMEKAQDLGGHNVEDAETAPGASIDPGKIANEKLNKELEPGDADDIADANATSLLVDGAVEDNTASRGVPSLIASTHDEQPNPDSDPQSESLLPETKPTPETQDQTAPIETFIADDVEDLNSDIVPNRTTAHSTSMPPPTQPIPLGPAAQYSSEQSQDYASRGRGSGRGYFRGSSDYRGAPRGRGLTLQSNLNIAPAPVPTAPLQPAGTEKGVIAPTEPKGLGVEGAPKAPKALREGLPNTGIRGGRGFSIIGRAASGTQSRASGNARSRSPSPARSRSRSRHTSNRHRSHRHRSASSSHGSDRETRRDRQRRHSHKYGDDDHDRSQMGNGSHTRENSPEESARRSSHKSHRDHTKEKDAGRSSHRSHRSHRERSRERDGGLHGGRRRSRSAEDRASRTNRLEESQHLSPTESHRKEKADETSQSLRKRRDREEDDRHRERKRSRRARSSEAEDQESSRRARHAKRDEMEIKPVHDTSFRGSDRTGEKSKSASTKPETDHHTIEREARNRERLVKELQRREAMEGKGSNSQRRESKADGRGGASSRRMSYKYEDEESNEARASRVESEREAGRWR